MIRFKFQQDITGISGATGKMIDKPVLPKFLLHLFVSYNFHFPRKKIQWDVKIRPTV